MNCWTSDWFGNGNSHNVKFIAGCARNISSEKYCWDTQKFLFKKLALYVRCNINILHFIIMNMNHTTEKCYNSYLHQFSPMNPQSWETAHTAKYFLLKYKTVDTAVYNRRYIKYSVVIICRNISWNRMLLQDRYIRHHFALTTYRNRSNRLPRSMMIVARPLDR